MVDVLELEPSCKVDEESEIVSLQSHSSQASIPEEEISIWVDETEEQNFKR